MVTVALDEVSERLELKLFCFLSVVSNLPHACGYTLKKLEQKDKYWALEQVEHLKKRMLSIMICTNWVCAGAFVDHDWVSERTIIQYEEEILGLELTTESMSHVWCNGVFYGFQHPRS